ncbi:MAG: hypothetical protein NDF54_06170 [archaeon GB-1867-035]|nr:hypothetical protein [Candidatus Culexmicrobium profundum]
MQSIKSKIKRILKRRKYDFQENFEINASAKWIVDFYIPDYAVAIIILKNLDNFFKVMFMAQDVMRTNPITVIIATPLNELPFQYIQLASRYGIIIMRQNNINLLNDVIIGEVDIEEINEKIPLTEKKAPRKLTKACKNKIIEALSIRPLTEDELIDSLKYEFPLKTIKWCLRTLKHQGKVKKLASLASIKKFVLGVKDEQLFEVLKYYNVSKKWKNKINVLLIQKTLKKSRKGLTITTIAKRTDLKIPQIVAGLRYLEKRKKVMRIIRRGKIYWKLLK